MWFSNFPADVIAKGKALHRKHRKEKSEVKMSLADQINEFKTLIPADNPPKRYWIPCQREIARLLRLDTMPKSTKKVATDKKPRKAASWKNMNLTDLSDMYEYRDLSEISIIGETAKEILEEAALVSEENKRVGGAPLSKKTKVGSFIDRDWLVNKIHTATRKLSSGPVNQTTKTNGHHTSP